MEMEMRPQSAILYQNPERTVFLIDVPASITLAQELVELPSTQAGDDDESVTASRGTKRKKKRLLSTPPLKNPYPYPPEPKTDAARKRVLERIPTEERSFHQDVVGPLVREGLRSLREGYARDSWCLSRYIVEEGGGFDGMERKRRYDDTASDPEHACASEGHSWEGSRSPPLILSPAMNGFETLSEIQNVLVKNTSTVPAKVRIHGNSDQQLRGATFTVPPKSTFLLCTLPMQSQSRLSLSNPIPGIPTDRKFNLILLDPPWPNRSVRRSAHYLTHPYSDMDVLIQQMGEILRKHLYNSSYNSQLGVAKVQGTRDNIRENSQRSIAAIWVTNAEKSRKAAYDAILAAGLSITEEWVWIKTTVQGEPVTPIEGLWRKPYEILIIGERSPGQYGEGASGGDGPKIRRVIAAVPDVHSRKPNLKQIFESVFFPSPSLRSQASGGSAAVTTESTLQYDPENRADYSALEVFARNLTAGWWACGNEVLKFNSDEWWVEE